MMRAPVEGASKRRPRRRALGRVDSRAELVEEDERPGPAIQDPRTWRTNDENVERSWARLCSSPITASTWSASGTRLPGAAGMWHPAWAMRTRRPAVSSATVLPPAFGPLRTRPGRSAGTRRSIGTTSPAPGGAPHR
jgi:hypothetical protein